MGFGHFSVLGLLLPQAHNSCDQILLAHVQVSTNKMNFEGLAQVFLYKDL